MIAHRLAEARQRAHAAAIRVGRDPSDVELIAISKRQPPDRIIAAYDAGQRSFGENRAQELVEHIEVVPSDASWHMVGHLQRNKAAIVGPLVASLHSLDSIRLARAWAPCGVPAYIQVNLAGEEQKGGVPPVGVVPLLQACDDLGIPAIGLMILPPFEPDPEASRPWFRRLAELRDELAVEFPAVRGLSMGMSNDFEVAIEEGSTVIRLGTTIFGPRQE